jgi:hypothetical protein
MNLDFFSAFPTFHAGAGETKHTRARRLFNLLLLIYDRGIRSVDKVSPFSKNGSVRQKHQNPLMMKRMIRNQYVLDIS